MRLGCCRFSNVRSVQIAGCSRWLVVGRWSVVGGRWSVVGGRWSVVGGRWSLSVVVGRWSLVGGRLPVVGRWSVVMWQFAPMRLLEYVAGRQKAKRR